MFERFALTGILMLGSIVALPKVPVFTSEVVAQLPTPAPPAVIPAWTFGGGRFYSCCNDVDPGATPDQHLFAGVLDASATTDSTLETNCPGIASGGSNVSNCNPYKYIDMFTLLCNGTLESSNAFNYLNGVGVSDGHETGFLHKYSAGTQTPEPANRIPVGGSCAPSPVPSTGFPTNPDDSCFQSWLVAHAWTTDSAHFPSPYGIYEDNFAAVGGHCRPSYEYRDEACNMRGTSGGPAPHDWETALGDFESNAEASCPTTCFAFIGNGLTPGDGANTAPCTNFEGVHCYATPSAGVVDDMDALDNLCSAADSRGNLQGITAEEIVFLKGVAPLAVHANTQTIVYMINTMSHLVNYTSGGCENTVAIDVESSGGSFPGLDDYPAGTVIDGIPIREEATALRFLVPDPKTLVPDRMQPFYFRIGLTTNQGTDCCEVPYFFEETMVPQDPKSQSVHSRTPACPAWGTAVLPPPSKTPAAQWTSR